jgi:hypothetical protein
LKTPEIKQERSLSPSQVQEKSYILLSLAENGIKTAQVCSASFAVLFRREGH